MESGHRNFRRNSGLLGLCGALATVLFHGLIFSALLWSDGGHLPRKPDMFGAGANVPDSGSEAISVLIFIDEPTAPRPLDEEATPVTSREAVQTASLVKIAALDPIPPSPMEVSNDGDRAAVATETDSDAASRARLFGQYEGQIKARVERAWLRPRTEIGDTLFHCRVKVLQDKEGNVLEVDLVSCNGSTRWQLSLASAIQAASPLPAPPNPNVFSEALTLAFTAREYTQESSDQGYESAPLPAARAQSTASNAGTTQSGLSATPSGVTYQRDLKSDVIYLRITGRPEAYHAP